MKETIETAGDGSPGSATQELSTWQCSETPKQDIPTPRQVDHEVINREELLNRVGGDEELIGILAEEMDLKLIGHGSTTLRKKNKRKGADPDDSYYLENVDQIRGKTRINLAVDPPPDLAIEIDVTSSSMDKFDLYAALGVPEFWRYENRAVHFYRLEGQAYCEIPASDHFPILTPEILNNYLALGQCEDITTMNKAFRKWVIASILVERQ